MTVSRQFPAQELATCRTTHGEAGRLPKFPPVPAGIEVDEIKMRRRSAPSQLWCDELLNFSDGFACRINRMRLSSSLGTRGSRHRGKAMGLIVLLLVLLLLFGGGGFYYGPPYHYYGGALGLLLLIVIVVLLFRRRA
jgi:hypothetical protein